MRQHKRCFCVHPCSITWSYHQWRTSATRTAMSMTHAFVPGSSRKGMRRQRQSQYMSSPLRPCHPTTRHYPQHTEPHQLAGPRLRAHTGHIERPFSHPTVVIVPSFLVFSAVLCSHLLQLNSFCHLPRPDCLQITLNASPRLRLRLPHPHWFFPTLTLTSWIADSCYHTPIRIVSA